MTVAVVGPGRAGRTIHARLRDRGVEAVLLRAVDDARSAELVLLAVPDAAQAACAAALDAKTWVGTLSGATPLAALGPSRRRFVLHPLQTMTGAGGNELDGGVPACVTGADDEALARAVALAERLGLVPVPTPEAARPLPHVACVLTGNAVATLVTVADRLLADAGLGVGASALLAPLLRRSLENALAAGSARATGPVARGDAGTLAAHLEALAATAPEVVPLYRALAAAALPFAEAAAAERVRPLLAPDAATRAAA